MTMRSRISRRGRRTGGLGPGLRRERLAAGPGLSEPALQAYRSDAHPGPGRGDQRGFLPHAAEKRLEYRKKVVDTSSCRLVFGEADFLPGLVVDKFSDVLVVESLALGIDRFKVTIVELLKELLAQDGIAIRGVYERSDAKVRLRRGWNGTRASWGLPLTPRWRSWRTGSATSWM